MTRFDHETVMQILSDVLALPQGERGALLDRSCQGDAALRAEIEELLRCEQRAARLFDDGQVELVQVVAPPEQIGPYRLLEQIGEGGMGSVYKAQQEYPLRRTVAIKIIKLGMDTREVIARFQAERQALALMDHPNVARAIDAGATPTGRPYFVMEYVQGEPITKFSDRMKLRIEQRLELFRQACDAVQHAHQKAIIHRDLKPSNILVAQENGKPWVKVIDFGVAKALDQRLTPETAFTQAGHYVGTLEYMSPEQAAGRASDVDTRSDVYSLGVVLYELLTGAVPFDAAMLRAAGYGEMQRIIRDVDPPRPSTKFIGLGEHASGVATCRQMQLDALEKQLHRELDWIPLKAMRKDRAQRYATATELSDDIGNYLANRPLRAGPESATYRARKFLGRNKAGVAASAGMALLLVAGIAATSWQAIRATRAQRQTRVALQSAEDAEAASQQVNTFLIDMLQAADPWPTKGKPVLVRDVLDRAAAGVSSKLAGQPRVEAAVRGALGESYVAVGLYSQADPHIAAMLALYQQIGGEEHPNTLTAKSRLAKLRRLQSKFDEALSLHRDVFERRLRLFGRNDRATIGAMNEIAVVLEDLGKLREAEPLYREARDRYAQTLGPDATETLRVTGNLGDLLNAMGHYEQAEPLLRASYEGRRRSLGDDDPDTLIAESDLADLLRHNGNLVEAESLLRHALEHTRKVVGDQHPRTSSAEEALAVVLKLAGRNEESTALYRASLARLQRSLGKDDPSTLTTLTALALNLMSMNKPAEAEPLLREAVEGSKRRLGPDHPTTIAAEYNFGIALELQDKWEESLPPLKDVHNRLRKLGQVQFPALRRAKLLGAYGICLRHLNRFEEAIEPLNFARSALIEVNDTASPHYHNVVEGLRRCAEALNRPDDVARWSAELRAYEAATRPTTRTTQPTTSTATSH